MDSKTSAPFKKISRMVKIMNRIVLIGAGGHAKTCVDVIEQEKKFKISFLLDKQIKKKNYLNIISLEKRNLLIQKKELNIYLLLLVK